MPDIDPAVSLNAADSVDTWPAIIADSFVNPDWKYMLILPGATLVPAK